MTKEQFLTELRVHIARNFKTQKAYSEHLGVSSAYLSMVCLGNKEPSKRILSDMGMTLKKTISFDYQELFDA